MASQLSVLALVQMAFGRNMCQKVGYVAEVWFLWTDLAKKWDEIHRSRYKLKGRMCRSEEAMMKRTTALLAQDCIELQCTSQSYRSGDWIGCKWKEKEEKLQLEEPSNLSLSGFR